MESTSTTDLDAVMENTTAYKVQEHYEIEKELSSRLRHASTEERKVLYGKLYDELFRRVPQHPQLVKKASSDDQAVRAREIQEQFDLLKGYLNKDVVFVEVGAGDCEVSFMVAEHVKQVFAVDVSEVITDSQSTPENFQLLLTDGTRIPVERGSAHVIYSNQLMEHLHPDDAKAQLKNIHQALAEKGIYFCQTPNKLNGPHDVSYGFDREATCFHLKEYTTAELARLFREIGFSKVQVVIGARGLYLTIPVFPVALVESMLNLLPHKLRTATARTKLFKALLDIRLIGTK